jgi:hypothetical protein
MIRLRPTLVLVCIASALLSPAAQANAPSREYQVKAAFIYNFTQFIEWPDKSFSDARSPLVVAVVGADPFGGLLENTFAGKTIANRTVAIKYFARTEDIGACHVLFVPPNEAGNLSEGLKRLDGQAVLLIGENDSFTADGGSIRFYTENNKIRFEVNLDATRAAGLKLSSKLLQLAKIFKR